MSVIFLGNYQEALNDATAAVKLEPTSVEAIETGKIITTPLIRDRTIASNFKDSNAIARPVSGKPQ